MQAQTAQQIEQLKTQTDGQLKQMEIQSKTQMEQMQLAFNKWKVEQDNQTKILIEQMKLEGTTGIEDRKISSAEQMKAAEFMRADQERMMEMESEKEDDAKEEALNQQVQQISQMVAQLAQHIGGSKVVGVEKVRDKAGGMVASRVRRADGSTDEITIQ